MINKAILLGRVGTKENKITKLGGQVCMISLATSRKYSDSTGKKKELTTWHNINFFNHLAEVANKFAHVGDLIYIEGEIMNKKVDENGKSRIIHSITASHVRVLPNIKKQNNDYEPNGNIDNENIEEGMF